MASKRARSYSPPATCSINTPVHSHSRAASDDSSDADTLTPRTTKKRKILPLSPSSPLSTTIRTDSSNRPDRLSGLSDELLIRILHLLPIECILTCQSVSNRFHRLAGDAQIWKGLYWSRWVRPRVRMLPRADGGKELLGDFSSRRSKWLDEGRLLRTGFDGADVAGKDSEEWNKRGRFSSESATGIGYGKREDGGRRRGRVEGTDWKARYKLRHNWSIGAAEVGEIGLGLVLEPAQDEVEDGMSENWAQASKTLMARLVDGGVITVDTKEGLRAWDIKRRECIAQCALVSHEEKGRGIERVPACLSVDTGPEGRSGTAVVVGFQDGGYEIWRLSFDVPVGRGSFEIWYRSPVLQDDKVGVDLDMQLNAVAYAHPYLLTITADHMLSLYVFNTDPAAGGENLETTEHPCTVMEGLQDKEVPLGENLVSFELQVIDSKSTTPRLLTSLKSHTCWPPLCLSIRSTPQTIIASIAYALPTYLSGWSVGLQELHLTRSGTILRSRLASAVEQGFHSLLSSSAPSTPPLSQSLRPAIPETGDTPSRSRRRDGRQTHPTSLSYSHPYLLAGNRDNTLSLYLVTSNNEELKISKSTTLWGHTSSISEAHVGGRGKAVSVSARGEELRVWELEGGLGRKVVQERSVLVRREGKEGSDCEDGEDVNGVRGSGILGREMCIDVQRRGWVGFNDEVVIVLKEEGEGGQALVVYDFT